MTPGQPPPGPPMGAPPPQPPPQVDSNWLDGQSKDLEMSGEDVRQWWARIELDRQKRKNQSSRWQRLFKGYMPPDYSAGLDTDVNSNIHFRNAELKKAEIWAQLPELVLSPLEPLSGMVDPMSGQPIAPEDIAAMKAAVLNKLLGRDGANVNLTVKEAVFDVLATSGIGATKICYQSDVAYPPSDAPTEDTPQPGSILGLGTPPTPPPQPVVVNERWRWYRFSTEKLGIPADFHSTNYDEAPYLFMEFIEPLTEQSRRQYNLPADFQPNANRDNLIIGKDQNTNSMTTSGKTQLLHGVEVWLYACHYDPTVAHSQVMRRLVLVEGLKDRAAIYRNSPYQSVDVAGQLTPDSLIGNPIHPLVLRVASDTAWVPADAAFTDPLVRVENTWMQQDLKMRDANLPRFMHSDKISTAVDKLKNMDTGQGVAIAHELMLQGGKRLIEPLPKLEHAESDSTGRAQNQRAITETLGIGSNQAGAPTNTVRSATENAIIAQNVSVRLKAEQNELLDWYLRGVRKFDALIQRYMTDAGYVSIIGAQGQRRLVAYTNAHLSGRYSYDAHPDSQLTIDQASRIQNYTTFVNFLAKSGFLNMPEIVRIGANTFGYDAARVIHDPPPPAPPPPAVSTSLQIGAPGLAANLLMPEVRAILAQLGLKIEPVPSAEAVALAAQEAADAARRQPPHGGSADTVDLVEKHKARETGQQPGQPPIAPAPQQPAAPTPAIGSHLVQ